MFEIGLKLWSINKNYVNEAVRLYEEGYYSFIELFVIPDSSKDYLKIWKSLRIPFIIHAPHYQQGVNLAKKECFKQNIFLAAEAQKFADELSAEFIIFHPGIAGVVEETVRQLNVINDSRSIIENKPYFTILNDANICNGHSPEQIEYIIKNTRIGFCLDISHCFCAANALNKEPFEYLEQFIKLKPQMFHLVDNDISSTEDKHLNIGKGNYDLSKILNCLDSGAKITLENEKNSKFNLNDFIEDVMKIHNYGKNLISNQ